MRDFVRAIFRVTRKKNSLQIFAGEFLHDKSIGWSGRHVATETRRAQYSRELLHADDYKKVKHIRALYSLSSDSIDILTARLHTDVSVRRAAAARVAESIPSKIPTKHKKTHKTQQFIIVMAGHILALHGVRELQPWALYDIAESDWHDSGHRQLWSTVERAIRRAETDALRQLWSVCTEVQVANTGEEPYICASLEHLSHR